MEDEFELISKGELAKLREGIKTIKSSKSASNSEKTQKSSEKTQENTQNSEDEENTESPTKIDSNTIAEIIKTIQKEGQKDRDLIIENLTNIKDINKTTLKNLLERTDKLDTRIGSLVDTISELVGTVKDLIVDDTKKPEESEKTKEILTKVNAIGLSQTSTNPKLLEKLNEIESFMNNLKILLGQIHPSEMQMKSNNNTNNELPSLNKDFPKL